MEKKLHPNIIIETEFCECCGKPLMNSIVSEWICVNDECVTNNL